MNFGEALVALKEGKKISFKDEFGHWVMVSGAGMRTIFYVPTGPTTPYLASFDASLVLKEDWIVIE